MALEITKLPPERGRYALSALACGTCCCCCCLHTVGALVGAAITPRPPPSAEFGIFRIFWGLFALTAVGAVFMRSGIFVAFIAAPLTLLGCVLVTGVLLGVRGRLNRDVLWILCRLIIRIILGTIAGIGIMMLLFSVLK